MSPVINPTVPPADIVAPPSRGYFHSLRDGRPRWWKVLVIIAIVAVSYLILSFALTMAAMLIEAVIRGVAFAEQMSGATMLTPLLFGSALLALAAMLPISIGLHRLLFRTQPLGALFSVEGRFRWRWAGQAMLIATIMVGAISALILAIEPRVLINNAGAPANPLQWLLVVLLVMPVQAAAEEVTFRGLLGRAVGGLFARAGLGTAIALVVSSVAFGSAHLAGDPWLIAYYLLFGLVAGVVAWRTGGIEAAVALHVVNNVVMGVIGTMLDRSIESGIDRSLGAGSPLILIHLGTLILTGAVLIIASRRLGVVVRAPAVAGRIKG